MIENSFFYSCQLFLKEGLDVLRKLTKFQSYPKTFEDFRGRSEDF